jgi:ABC-type dipeptide/oligopeptide/nickel transport system permease component
VTIGYVLRRVGVFFLIVVLAVSINFFIPRLRSTNPIEQRMLEMAAQGGGRAGDIRQLIAIYNEKFGLDKPLWEQYLNYWRDWRGLTWAPPSRSIGPVVTRSARAVDHRPAARLHADRVHHRHAPWRAPGGRPPAACSASSCRCS